MSVVTVQAVGQESLNRAEKLLSGIPGGVDKAVKSAMQRAVSHLRTNSAKVIQEKYDISAANIRANENVTIRYSYQDGVQAFVNFAGGKIPLFRYGGASPGTPAFDQSQLVPVMIHGKWRRAHPGVPAHGHQRKDTSPSLFEHAFVAQMESGHVGIFERNGGESRSGGDSISEIMGSSVSQIFCNILDPADTDMKKPAEAKPYDVAEHRITLPMETIKAGLKVTSGEGESAAELKEDEDYSLFYDDQKNKCIIELLEDSTAYSATWQKKSRHRTR